MSGVECFLDTNILLYAASRNPADLTKKKIATDLMAKTQFGLSAQVLQEFYSVATRKAQFGMAPDRALEWIEILEEFPCLAVDAGLVEDRGRSVGAAPDFLLGRRGRGSSAGDGGTRPFQRGSEPRPELRWRAGAQPLPAKSQRRRRLP